MTKPVPQALPVTDGVAGKPVVLPSGDYASYIDWVSTSTCVALGSAQKSDAMLRRLGHAVGSERVSADVA